MAYTVPKLTDYSTVAMQRAAVELLSALDQEAAAVRNEADSKLFRDRWMARKNGVLAQVNDLWLKGAPKDSKREAGQVVNMVRTTVEKTVKETQAATQVAGTLSGDDYTSLPPTGTDRMYDGHRYGTIKDSPVVVTVEESELGRPFSRKRAALYQVDISLPGVRRPIGAEHPILKTSREMCAVFQKLGYSIAEGPVVETDYYNFEALNFPPNHPARDTQDTLFIAGQQSKAQRERLLLRTHTSPVQIRTMEKLRPPIRIVIPGTVHRNDPPDASHSPMFHQIEGLAVDTNITFGDLKGTLDHAMKEFFGSSVKTSFRPSFFPFTEPSAELYISCFICGGSGSRGSDPCRPCKQTGWIEILGCGMVDPNVFEFVKDNGYDPKRVSGFAFGMGADRIALLKYGVDDLQLFFSGDVRFLQQWA